MPSCNGAKWIDVLHIRGSARHAVDNLLDLLLAQLQQRQHGRCDHGAISRNQVRRHDDRPAFLPRGFDQVFQRRPGKQVAHIHLESCLAHPFDGAQGQQGMASQFKEVVVASYPFAL